MVSAHHNGDSPLLQAAVLAAVELYLADEAAIEAPRKAGSRWRAAERPFLKQPTLWRALARAESRHTMSAFKNASGT